MRNIAVKVDDSGDTLSAGAFNANFGSELEGIATSADFTLDSESGPDTNLTMLAQSIAAYVGAAAGYQDSGAANAYVLSQPNNLKTPSKYYDGMKVYFKAGNSNTGASTINIAAIGSKDLQYPDGTPLNALAIISGSYITAVYNLSDDRFELIDVDLAKPGDIKVLATDAVPFGYAECNGQNLSRTTYADLFARIGVIWGNGDGSTTFTVPDFRGKFLRGWDHGAGNDPDSASRTAQATGGNAGDNVGSIQAHAVGSHKHYLFSYGQITYPESGSNSTRNYLALDNATQANNGTDWYAADSIFSGNTSTENRPINANVLIVIKL